MQDPYAFDSNRGSYINAVDALTFNTGTPLAKALLNIGQLFSSTDDVYRMRFGFSDYVFKSSFRNYSLSSQGRSWCWGCQASSVIVIADGEPSGDSVPSTTKSRIQALNGGPVTCPVASECVDETGQDSMLDDVARLLATQDLQESTPVQIGDFNTAGRQSLRIHTVSIGNDSKLLRNTALVGNGRYALAYDVNELKAALYGVLAVTGSSDAAVSEVGSTCDAASGTLLLHARLSNLGNATLPPGLRVGFYADGSGTLLGVATLVGALDPQLSTRVAVAVSPPPGGLGNVVAVVEGDDSGAMECNTSNNSASATLDLSCGASLPEGGMP
jgi:type IV pilus assembly protein PilY1